MKGNAKKGRKNRISRSERAELFFPVARIASYLRKGHYAMRYTEMSAIALTAVL